jgi:hypothetical protein
MQWNGDHQHIMATDGFHNHGIPEGYFLLVEGGGSIEFTPSGHSHTTTVSEPHAHAMISVNHDHDVIIPEHNHTITLDDHAHEITVPSHMHDIDYGIY